MMLIVDMEASVLRIACFSLMSFVFIVLSVNAGSLFGDEWKPFSVLLVFCSAISAMPLIDPVKSLLTEAMKESEGNA